MIAPLGSITIAMIKNSAIVGASIVALSDVFENTRIAYARSFDAEVFVWAAAGYLLLTVATTIAFRQLERRLTISR